LRETLNVELFCQTVTKTALAPSIELLIELKQKKSFNNEVEPMSRAVPNVPKCHCEIHASQNFFEFD
jgi:hypothetical protein